MAVGVVTIRRGRSPKIRNYCDYVPAHPPFVNAIKEARRFIERHPGDDNSRILASLVLALESDREFELASLYKLNYKAFDLAIEILREWRLDRYISGKAKLFDLSLQVSEQLAQNDADAAALATAPATSS